MWKRLDPGVIKNGLKDCSLILAAAAAIGVVSGYLVDFYTGFFAGFLGFVAGSIYQGTVYHRKYGPLLFSQDGKAFVRLFQYSLGYGMLAGFPLAFISFHWNQQFSPVASLVLALIAIPFFSMSMLGAFWLGRLLNRNLDE